MVKGNDITRINQIAFSAALILHVRRSSPNPTEGLIFNSGQNCRGFSQAMGSAMIIIGILAGLIVLVVILWIGLKIKPGPFAPLPVQGSELNTMTLPEDLPPPVERFYRTVFGDRVPVIGSAVISGRA
jgi:hypothetical protein